MKFYDKISRSKSVRMVWINDEIFKKNGKIEMNFTDCTNLAIMKALNIQFAFTLDKNFEQAGFVKLL